MVPTAEEQIRFLINLQRLLEEGQFVASYKFALLLALADLSVETGDDCGSPLRVTTEQIAVKFVEYYWRQSRPYVTAARAEVLKQNAGRQAAVLNVVAETRNQCGDSVASALRDFAANSAPLRRIAGIVRQMPLWKLQTIGRQQIDFLYPSTGAGKDIELRAGVAYCFRKFHGLVSDLVRGAWVRYVRQQNMEILGETSDLNEFLFGSERTSLTAVRPVLMDVQRGSCFYCGIALTPAGTHVDHFIAWSRYSVDLGHNFVLADSRCNSKKRERIAAAEHLSAWTERNRRWGDEMAAFLRERGIVCDLACSNRVTEWAYAQTEISGGLTWLRGEDLVPLDPEWRQRLYTA